MLEATGLQSAALPIGRSLQNKSKVCGGRIRTFNLGLCGPMSHLALTVIRGYI